MYLKRQHQNMKAENRTVSCYFLDNVITLHAAVACKDNAIYALTTGNITFFIDLIMGTFTHRRLYHALTYAAEYIVGIYVFKLGEDYLWHLFTIEYNFFFITSFCLLINITHAIIEWIHVEGTLNIGLKWIDIIHKQY